MGSLNDLWRYKHLIFYFFWRDITIRYRRTFFGYGWLVIRPALMTFILVMIFKPQLGGLPVNMPVEIYILTGYLCWQFLASSISEASVSLLNNIASINKIYYPRTVLPLASVMVNLFDFMVGYLLIILMLTAKFKMTFSGLTLSFAGVVLLVGTIIGISLLLASLIVRFRDIKFTLPFILQVGIMVTPIAYQLDVIAGFLKPLFLVNPVTSPMEIIRFALFGYTGYPLLTLWLIGITQTLVLLIAGWFVFRNTEKTLADII